jgi:hypothetical protein
MEIVKHKAIMALISAVPPYSTLKVAVDGWKRRFMVEDGRRNGDRSIVMFDHFVQL